MYVMHVEHVYIYTVDAQFRSTDNCLQKHSAIILMLYGGRNRDFFLKPS